MYRINKLLKLRQQIYHTADLALLWQISNKNTLYTTIARLVKKGVLLPLQKGLYSTVPINQLEPVRVGIAFLHRFAYLSTESVLVKEGIINQIVYPITLISDVSRKFKVGHWEYLVRRMAPKFLYNPVGITEKDGIFMAGPERAIVDLLYFDSHYFFDNKDIINWSKVSLLKKEIGFK